MVTPSTITRILLVFTCLAQALFISAQNTDSVIIKTTKLTSSLYMLEAKGGGNIAVCTGNEGTFVVDDQFAPLTDMINREIQKFTSQPVRFLVNTHWHGDHSGGNENFGNQGVIIVSHENSRKRMEIDQLFGIPPHPQKAYSYSGLPKVTFTQSMTFHYNGQTIEIFHIAKAHSDGDAVIWFRQANVIHMGDVFVRYGLPFIDEANGGNVNGMIETIDNVLQKINDSTTIIPGHGQLSTKKDLITYNTMLRTIRDRVKEKIDKGDTLEQIIPANTLKGYIREGADQTGFVTVVYNSILKSRKQ